MTAQRLGALTKNDDMGAYGAATLEVGLLAAIALSICLYVSGNIDSWAHRQMC